MKILVTGGAGYIGSHTCIELINAGFEVVIADNLINSSIKVIERIESLVSCSIPFYELDIRDKESLTNIFQKHKIDGVIHFAGLKSVVESIKKPIEYYYNNLSSIFVLVNVMKEFECKNLVFSSSATVYGDQSNLPIKEDSALSAINPYGQSKLMIEKFLQDVFASDENWQIAILRYFNPVGAHKSGLIGEDPKEVPSNLLPHIAQVAMGKLEKLKIFGGDYDTYDGTGIRDYIHVIDLARGHIKALNILKKKAQVLTVNLGTGKGFSVLEIVKAFEKASGKDVPYEIVERRAGDIAISFADSTYAKEKLNWESELDLEKMCEDTWRWQSKNPNGYY